MNLPRPAVSTAQRLAVYGTLAPGEVNHHLLVDLDGRWIDGEVHGHLHASGWGAALGFPGLILDPAGPTVRVRVLESPDLPGRWSRLDAFEGPGYDRVETLVRTSQGNVEACIYVLAARGLPDAPD